MRLLFVLIEKQELFVIYQKSSLSKLFCLSSQLSFSTCGSALSATFNCFVRLTKLETFTKWRARQRIRSHHSSWILTIGRILMTTSQKTLAGKYRGLRTLCPPLLQRVHYSFKKLCAFAGSHWQRQFQSRAVTGKRKWVKKKRISNPMQLRLPPMEKPTNDYFPIITQ